MKCPACNNFDLETKGEYEGDCKGCWYPPDMCDCEVVEQKPEKEDVSQRKFYQTFSN